MSMYENTDRIQINDLKASIPNLTGGALAGARSLVEKYTRYGNLSDKQWNFAASLIRQAATPVADRDKPKAVNVGDFSGVIGLFEKAKTHLKHPKFRLQLEDGSPVHLSMSGINSRAPGTINVTDGGPFGANKWFGRVRQDGTWEASKIVSPMEMADLKELLEAMSKHPAETAAHYGKLTGRCCFCNLPLTDERSTAVGYGSTCADHWGLPWGEK